MTTFQDNFVNLDTDPQFQFIATNSLSTNSPSTNSSNLSEDACSASQSFQENFDASYNLNENFKVNYKSNNDSNGESVCESTFRNSQNYESTDADIKQLVEFVDRIECEFELERKLNLSNLSNQNEPDLFAVSKGPKINETFCSIQQDHNAINNFSVKNFDKFDKSHQQTMNVKLEKLEKLDESADQSPLNHQQNEHLNDSMIRLEKHIPRPPNSFMIFGKQNRKLLANQFPDYTNKQISKILGDEWRKMDLEAKQHFHRLADEAHKKHMEKYPNYYYSPLEARQRKADRKKKFIQKINSKRTYKQSVDDSRNDQIKSSMVDVMNVGQMINFSGSSSPASSNSCSLHVNNVNSDIKFEQQISKNDFNVLNDQYKIADQNVLDARLNQMVNSPIHDCNRSSASCTQSAYSLDQINQMNNLSNNIENGQNVVGNISNNYEPFKPNQKYTLNQFGNLVDRKLNNRSNYQLQPNVVYFSPDNLSNNNMMHQLLNDQQQQSTNMKCRALNNQQYFLNDNNQMDNSFYPHHYSTANNFFTTPTIYHVTNKDPNLNSTLNENCFMNNYGNSLNFNQNLNANQLFSLSNHHPNNCTLSHAYNSQSENAYNSSVVNQMFSFDEILVDAEKQHLYYPQQQVLNNKNSQLNNKFVIKWE